MPSPPPPLITSSSTASSRGGPGRSTGSYCLPPACYHRTSHMCRHRTPTTRGGPRAVEDRCRSRVEAARGGLQGDKQATTRGTHGDKHHRAGGIWRQTRRHHRSNSSLGGHFSEFVYIIAQSQYSNFIKRQKSMVYVWSKQDTLKTFLFQY